MKIKWTVQPAPTGQFKSFAWRGWPIAEFENGDLAAVLSCEDDYVPLKVKTGEHAPIKVIVVLWGNATKEKPQPRGTLKARAASLKEAKELVMRFYDANPQHIPQS